MFSKKISNSVKRRIYLDYAASTPIDKRVISAMRPYWRGEVISEDESVFLWGNASSTHREGVTASLALEKARKSLAQTISSKKEEIIFTSGGTESNNLAVFGVVNNLIYNKKIPPSQLHIITSSIEHPSVLDCFTTLEKRGVSVTYVGVDEKGRTNPEDVSNAIRTNTVLISISYANSEIGVIQPISKIGRAIKKKSRGAGFPLLYHTDASQAPLFLDCDISKLGVDLMTIDAQKMYGPKGIGFLYKRNGVSIEPLFKGGNQEFSLRPGTSNTPLIVGLERAFDIAVSGREVLSKEISELRDYFIASLLKNVPRAELNGDSVDRLPNNINISIPGMDGEFLTVLLDNDGIASSTKSACLGKTGESSYVISALGKEYDRAKSSLRFSLGRETEKKDLDIVVRTLQKHVEHLINKEISR